jgi:hypothetical protein
MMLAAGDKLGLRAAWARCTRRVTDDSMYDGFEGTDGPGDRFEREAHTIASLAVSRVVL